MQNATLSDILNTVNNSSNFTKMPVMPVPTKHNGIKAIRFRFLENPLSVSPVVSYHYVPDIRRYVQCSKVLKKFTKDGMSEIALRGQCRIHEMEKAWKAIPGNEQKSSDYKHRYESWVPVEFEDPATKEMKIAIYKMSIKDVTHPKAAGYHAYVSSEQADLKSENEGEITDYWFKLSDNRTMKRENKKVSSEDKKREIELPVPNFPITYEEGCKMLDEKNAVVTDAAVSEPDAEEELDEESPFN